MNSDRKAETALLPRSRPSFREQLVSRYLSLLCLLALPGGLVGQQPMSLSAVPVGTIELDGVLDEPIWSSIEPLTMTTFEPSYGEPPSERTEIRITYDDRAIYASGRFYDSEPEGIRENSLIRDYYAQDDLFNLVLDTFNDDENAVYFVVTPAGTRIDGGISNDAEGAWNNRDLDLFWDAATSRDAEGWSVEVRIPFSSLRFQPTPDGLEMGLIAGRVIMRKKERVTFPPIRPGASAAQFKPSNAATVWLDGVDQRPPLHVGPYLLLGSDNHPGSDLDENTVDGGVDVKVGLAENFTLDLTVNPDFAQTEVDDQRVNLTRFPLFFPEKREFFQERAGVFDFDTGGSSRLFFSRRLGLAPDGTPDRIYGGARLVGRVRDWDVAMLNMQIDNGAAAGGNMGVVRVRRTLFDSNSYIGAMSTTRVTAEHRHAAFGADAVVRLFGATYLTTRVAGVLLDGRPVADFLDRSIAFASVERRDLEGLGYAASIRRIGADYDPFLGFVERVNAIATDGRISHGWFHGAGLFRDHTLSLTGSAVRRRSDDEIDSSLIGTSYDANLKGGISFGLSIRRRTEDVLTDFSLDPNTVVTAGDYAFVETTIRASTTSSGSPFRIGSTVTAGGFFGGRRLTAIVSPVWNLSKQIEFSGDYELTRLDLQDGSPVFNGDVVRFRTRFSMNARLSLSALVQYNRVQDVMASNARLRLNFAEGHDLFLVFNSADTSSDALKRGLPEVADRVFRLKYSRTWTR